MNTSRPRCAITACLLALGLLVISACDADPTSAEEGVDMVNPFAKDHEEIASSEDDLPPVDCTLACWKASPAELGLGMVAVGTAKTADLLLMNCGEVPLDIVEMTIDDDAFSVAIHETGQEGATIDVGAPFELGVDIIVHLDITYTPSSADGATDLATLTLVPTACLDPLTIGLSGSPSP